MVLGEDSVLEELSGKRPGPRRRRDQADASAAAGSTDSASPASVLKDAAAKAALTAERELVLSALQRTHWNRKQAARLLGVSYRTIRSKIKHYELDTL